MKLETMMVSKIYDMGTSLGDVDEHRRFQESSSSIGEDHDIEEQIQTGHRLCRNDGNQRKFGEVDARMSYYDSIKASSNDTMTTGDASGYTPTSSNSGGGDRNGRRSPATGVVDQRSMRSFVSDSGNNDGDILMDLNDTTKAMGSAVRSSNVHIGPNGEFISTRTSSSSSEGRFLSASRFSSTTRQSQLRSISDCGMFESALNINLDVHHRGASPSSASTTKKQLASLVQKESNWLSKTRILMMLVLLVVTTVSAIVTYYVACKIERNAFTSRYKDFAKETLTVSTQINSINIRNIYEIMSLQLTAYTISPSSGVWAGRDGGGATDDVANSDRNWPFVQINEWDSISSKIINITGANFVAFTPLVSHENRMSYETYTLLNQAENAGGNGLPFIYHHAQSQGYGMDDASSSPSIRPAQPADLYAPIAHIVSSKEVSISLSPL